MRNFVPGEIVCIPRSIEPSTKNSPTLYWGRIVYIHPEKRFLLVAFKNSRECFLPSEIELKDVSDSYLDKKREMADTLPTTY